MSKSRNNKGITLVALIITIIVLLILAMVSIRLVMNGGIIDRAERGTEAYSDAEIEEQLKLAYKEYQMAKYSDSGYTLQNALEKTGLDIASVEGNDSTGYEIKVNTRDGEKAYVLQTNGSIGVASTEWSDNGNGSWTKGIRTIKIGDVVNYDPTKDASGNTLTTTYTSYGTSNPNNENNGRLNGYRDQTFSVSATTNGWRVLGVNQEGQIELISADPIQTSSNDNYYLDGEKGYLYGTDELNAICSIFGQGKGAGSARSLNVDDVDKLAGIKTEADKKACNSNYGSKWKYRYPEGGYNIQSNSDTGTGYSDSWTISPDQKFRMPGAAASTEINRTNRGESPELTYTSYSYNFSSKIAQTNISNLISNGTTSGYLPQWFASSYVACYNIQAAFGMRTIDGESVDYINLFYSNMQRNYGYRRVRPIVSLKTSTNLEWNSTTNQWNIK